MLCSLHEPRDRMMTQSVEDEVDSSTERLRAAHTNLAASTAVLPVTPEMAWTVPQLLKRVQLLSPGIRSIASVHWKYDLGEMTAKYDGASGAEVLEHCRALVSRNSARQPVDWDA